MPPKMGVAFGSIVQYQPTAKESPMGQAAVPAIVTQFNEDDGSASLTVFPSGAFYIAAKHAVTPGDGDGQYLELGQQSQTQVRQQQEAEAQAKAAQEQQKKAEEEAKQEAKQTQSSQPKTTPPHAASR
jgi:hypothetical protein